MPSFQTVGKIQLQPGDNLAYSFQMTVCSSVLANDGHLPYGTTVSSVVCTARNHATKELATDLIDSTATVLTNIITVALKYPDTSGDGRYKLTFALVLSNGDTINPDFNRVYCEDK